MKTTGKYESLEQLIDLLIEHKDYVEDLIKALKAKPSCFEEELISKYIVVRSTPKVGYSGQADPPVRRKLTPLDLVAVIH